MDPDRPYLNRTVVSRRRAELLLRVGSRYAPASPCADLKSIEESDRPMVMVGKPCDIASTQRARRLRPALDRNLSVTISIFCAGTPSTRGTLQLLRALGVEQEQISDLQYRGHGWPGMAGVGLKGGDHRRVEMTYRQAWDGILTRHIAFRCRICPDGTGEFADLSCGDPWYRTIEAGEKGSSLILVRTERGRAVFQGALRAGYILAEPRPADVLPRSQKGLLTRRRTLWPKAMWAAICRWPFPQFQGMRLFRNWLDLPFGMKWASLYRAARYLLGLAKKGPVRRTAREVAAAEPALRLELMCEVKDERGYDHGEHADEGRRSSTD
jgi:coenzyme F420 hydrogenase subunit beta